MPFPSTPVTTANLDSVLDPPYDARPDLLDMATKLNAVLASRSELADADHVHEIADVTGLQTALDAKQDSSAKLTAVAGLSGTGLVKKDGTNSFTLDTQTYQPLDATLTAIAGASTSANRLHYWSGVDTVSVAEFTSYARALCDDQSFSDMRNTLGLTIGANVQAYHINLDKVSNGTYQGSGSIITLGGVVTGQWQATPIDPIFGGTGTAGTLTGYVYGNGASDMTASATIPDTDVDGAQQTLTDAGSITWNMASGRNAVLTLGGTGRSIAPTNVTTGKTCVLKVIQGVGGAKTITTWTGFKWNGGTAPTLTTTAGRWDVFVFYADGTNLLEIARNLNQS
jgi:hypothetical protein